MKATAYTVGNPDSYEEYLDTEETMKGVGGVVFITKEEAEASVADGFLPFDWYERVIPGKVYGLVCDVETDVETWEHGLRLNKAALLVRV